MKRLFKTGILISMFLLTACGKDSKVVEGGISWVEVTGTTQQAQSNMGYIANNQSQVTITLPVSPTVGDIVQVSGVGSGGWKIAQNDGQYIKTKILPFLIPHESNREWQSVASSSDGTKLVAVVSGGQVYTSTDSGENWIAHESNRRWWSVASSSDGTKLVAVVFGGQIYTSTDSGENWTPHESDRYWLSVASSSDGTKLVALGGYGRIYTSTDSGENWTLRESNRDWKSVASSSDGTKLVAVVYSGQIYTSSDSGENWIVHNSKLEGYGRIRHITLSLDGNKLVVIVNLNGQIYTSTQNASIYTSDPNTSIGTAGAISGGQYDAIELQYIGDNKFIVLSHEGDLIVK